MRDRPRPQRARRGRAGTRGAPGRCLALLIALLGPATAVAQTLQSGATRIHGVLSDDGQVEAFLGVPFAAPPTGERRWMEPQPLQLPPGDLYARDFAPACAQGSRIVDWYKALMRDFGANPELFPVPSFDEDCLYLNIWRPATRSEPLALLVFIHGGSNAGGWAYEPNYLGAALARRGIAVATIAYRLDVFGFFDHPELPRTNFALLDQIAALQWLRQHASTLDIDLKRITLMGESAGASNISYLMVSPLARGLFNRAIHQSAGWALWRSSGDADRDGATAIDLQRSLLGEQGDIGQLRAIDASRLLAYSAEAGLEHEPVIDGHSVTTTIKAGLTASHARGIDLLIGSNADEWLIYLDESATLDEWRTAHPEPGKADAMLAALDPSLTETKKLDRLVSAEHFVCPSLELAALSAQRDGQTWFYYFDQVRDGPHGAAMGAYHGAELPYVFESHDPWLPTDDDDRALGNIMATYWVNFVKTGNPNGPDLPPWPAYGASSLEQGHATRTYLAAVQFLGPDVHSGAHPSAALCEARAGAGSRGNHSAATRGGIPSPLSTAGTRP